MANNLIQIKRSATAAAPTTLSAGELAYSNTSKILYIGSTDAGASIVPIGGIRNPGVLTANQALVANSTSGIDSIIVSTANIHAIYANGTLGTAGQVLATNATAIYWTTVPAAVTGLDTYVQFNDGGNLNAVSSFTYSKTTGTLTVGTGFTTNTTLTTANAINVTNQTNTATLYVATSANVGTAFTANSTAVHAIALDVTGNTSVGGDLVVSGKLYVAGNTFFVNATAITTNDKALYLSNNTGTSLLTDGAGFYVGNTAAPIASFLYNNSTTSFQSTTGLTPSTNNLSLGAASNLWNLYANQIAGTITTATQPNITSVGGQSVSSFMNSTSFSSNASAYLPTYTGVVNGSSFTVGTNFVANSTTMLVGGTGLSNGVSINSTAVFIGNSTVSTTTNATSFSGTANNSTNLNGQAAAYYTNATNISTGTLADARLSANYSTGTALTANNASYLGGTPAASYQLNSTLSANIASYLPTYTGVVNGSSFTVGTTYVANATNILIGGTGLSNGVNSNTTAIFIGNSTVSTTINATSFTGTATNATNLNSQPATYYTNATNISTGTLADARLSANYSTGTALTANNASYLGGTPAASYQLNSTLSANIASYLPTYNGVVNGSSFTVGTTFVANATTMLVGGTGIATGVNANTTTIFIGNNTVSATINSTSFSGTAANATNLNGQAAAYYTNATNISTGALGVAYGGTAQTSYTTGDILYASASTTLSKLSVPGATANGQVLQIVNNLPAYGTLDGGSF